MDYAAYSGPIAASFERAFVASSGGAAAGAGVALSKTFHALSGAGPGGGVLPPLLGEPVAPLPSVGQTQATFRAPSLAAHGRALRLRVTRRASADVVTTHFESDEVAPGDVVAVPIVSGELYAGEWVSIAATDSKSGPPTPFSSTVQNAACFVPPQPVLELLIEDEDDPDSEVDLRITAPAVVPGGWQLDLLMREGEFGALTTLAIDVSAGAQLLLSELGEAVGFDRELRFSWKPRQVL